LYAHMKKLSVSVGNYVTRGQQLGIMGETGLSEGEHIHFQLNFNGLCKSSVPQSKPEPMSGYTNFKAGNSYYARPFNESPSVPSNIRQLFTQFYNEHGGSGTFGNAWDNGRGTGIHLWPDEGGNDALWVQDYKKGSIWSQLVYNPHLNQVFAVFNKTLYFWNRNWGYRDYGPPVINEIGAGYSGGNYGRSEDWMIFQKFSKTSETTGPFKTIVWNSRTDITEHCSVGLNEIRDYPGALIYIDKNGRLERWPNENTVSPTSQWLMDAGVYQFWVKDSNGNQIVNFAHTVTEGNTQYTKLPAVNLPVISLSKTSLDFGTTSTQESFYLSNSGAGNLTWNISDNREWIATGSSAGSGHRTVYVNVDRAKMTIGNNSGTITVNSNGGNKTISVMAEKENSSSNPPLPSNLANSACLQNGKLVLTGSMFGPGKYCLLVLAGGNNPLLWLNIPTNGGQFSVPGGYDRFSVTLSRADNAWYWEGRSGYTLVGFRFHDGWFWLNEMVSIQTPSNPPIPPPQPPPNEQNNPPPSSGNNSIKFNLAKREIELNGQLFNVYSLMVIGGGDKILLFERISDSAKKKIPAGYTKVNFINGNDTKGDWFYPGKNSYQVSENNVKWQSDGWYYLQGLSKINMGEGTVASNFEFSLFQNYPNPFNPETIIEYELAEYVHVVLAIYNLQGQLIEKLMDDYQPAGIYQISWQVGNLPSGVYFYSLDCGQFKVVKKMIVSK